jgi:hypothetical protein
MLKQTAVLKSTECTVCCQHIEKHIIVRMEKHNVSQGCWLEPFMLRIHIVLNRKM